jgi:hypothetical protein
MNNEDYCSKHNIHSIPPDYAVNCNYYLDVIHNHNEKQTQELIDKNVTFNKIESKKEFKVTANDLQKWIDHLTPEERELPIIVSKHIHPDQNERFYMKHIMHGIWNDGFNGFVFIVEKKE